MRESGTVTDTGQLGITVREPGADPDRHDELAGYLLRELSEVSDVRRNWNGGVAIPGARGSLEMAGALAVGLQHSAALVPHAATVVSTIRGWLSRSAEPARTVEVEYDGLKLKLLAASAPEQDKLVDAFLNALTRKLDTEGR